MLKTISIGIPSESILRSLGASPAFFGPGSEPVFAMTFINERGEEYFCCEYARPHAQEEGSYLGVCTKAMPEPGSAGESLLRRMRKAGVCLSEPELSHDGFVRAFSTEELLDILNGLRCMYDSVTMTFRSARWFSGASHTGKAAWEPALKACMRAVKAAVARIFVTDLSYRETDDGDPLIVGISGKETAIPAALPWLSTAAFPAGCRKCYGISTYGVVKYAEGRPALAMPFNRWQRFAVKMAGTVGPVDGIKKDSAGPAGEIHAVFGADVAKIYSLIPDMRYPVSGTECRDGRRYIAVINTLGQEVWLNREKATILS